MLAIAPQPTNGADQRCRAGNWRGMDVAISCITGQHTPQEVRAFDSRAGVARHLDHPCILPLRFHNVVLLNKPSPGVRGDYKLYLVKVPPPHPPELINLAMLGHMHVATQTPVWLTEGGGYLCFIFIYLCIIRIYCIYVSHVHPSMCHMAVLVRHFCGHLLH